ncbi:MAG: ABC transporter ATP-binding protein [Candidatus Lokiarchaeota archaeon]|nr:ABC transporter ATP-binding protein [Candidatus Lokiarchaeota archaeon]
MLVHGSPKRRVLSIILSIVAAGAYLNPFNLEKLVLFLVDRSPLIPIIFLITFPALLIVGTILVRNEGLELFGGLFTCISSFMILVVNIYFITFFSMIVLIVGLIGGFLGILAHKDITNPMKLDLRHFAYLKVREALEKVKIPDPDKVMHSFPHELSGGMRQRVMIAMALACNPDLLIADEPTTALDVTIQAQILSLMRDLKARFKTSILLITHDLGVVAEMCDRVAVMYSGRIIEYAPVKSLFKQPLHPYTQGLMASIPKVEEKKEKLLIIPGSVPNLMRPPAGCRFHPRCPRRMPMCDKALPQLVEAQPGHKVACYLYVDGNKEV